MTRNAHSKKLLGSFVAFLIAIVCYFIYLYEVRHPSTDNAYVQANTVNVAAQVTGPILAIYVRDHQLVKNGQLLFTIDPSPFQIAVARSAAVVAEIKAQLLYAEQNSGRIFRLADLGQESKESRDLSASHRDSKKAELAADEAQLNQAQLDLIHTRVIAPKAGIITQFYLQPGDNVVADTTLFMIVEQDVFWVDANFKETQVGRIKPGQPAAVVLDMYPSHVFHGVVDAVSSASGSAYSLLPPENASGNWVKVTQRIPVKVIIQDPDPDFPLRVGATATVTVDTTTFAVSPK